MMAARHWIHEGSAPRAATSSTVDLVLETGAQGGSKRTLGVKSLCLNREREPPYLANLEPKLANFSQFLADFSRFLADFSRENAGML